MGLTTLLLLVILASLLMFVMMGRCGRGHDRPKVEREVPPAELTPDQENRLNDVIRPSGRRRIGSVIAVEGELLLRPDEAYRTLEARFAGSEIMPALQANEYGKPSVMLLPRKLFAGREYKDRLWLHAVLLAATVGTTMWAGAAHQGVNVIDEPVRLLSGLPYALALMLILGIHEMGHYLAAKAHKMMVSLPFFIPAPFGLGTFGAFIQLREASANRRALFDVGVSGPLAGLVVTIAVLFVGLQYSDVLPPEEPAKVAAHHGAEVGSSILFAAMAKVSLGAEIAAGHQLILHPLAFAGWLGLLVTALNLLPIGQLDGGHIADAMFGPRMAAGVSTAAIVLLFALALFVWSGLLMWAFIIYFIAGRKGMPPLNDLAPLGVGRLAIGWLSFILLLLILSPVPHAMYQNFGLHCPYL